ncbi:MAG: HlyC/CorC family transporter [Deltaproteobacteria bacterium]|nr:HlyC/CorC family transporter [Deltaproteobacteria bacterium]
MGLAIVVLVIAFFIAVEAFFSGSEIAFISANRAKLFREAKEGNRYALIAKYLLTNPESLFSTTVVGTTLAINCSTTIATLYLIQNYGYSKEWVILALLTPAILIFGEFVPKTLGRARADNACLKVCRLLYLSSFILYPFTKLLSLYAKTLKLLFAENPAKSFFLSREEIKGALPASRGTDVTASERALIEKILEFGKITVKEMFRPLIDVVAIEENQSIREAITILSDTGHSRIPVYRDRVDRVTGILVGFDCLRTIDLAAPVKSIMQPPFFVPESKPLDELLLELREKPMAVAVNEYGGAEGIITMEDVMEEVVGEIEDEYDEPPKLYYRIGENSYIVNARMEIDDIRELLRIPIPKDEDYQTLAGFLLKKMQKLPKKWDSALIDGVEYIIQSTTDRSIEEVYVVVHEPIP